MSAGVRYKSVNVMLQNIAEAKKIAVPGETATFENRIFTANRLFCACCDSRDLKQSQLPPSGRRRHKARTRSDGNFRIRGW